MPEELIVRGSLLVRKESATVSACVTGAQNADSYCNFPAEAITKRNVFGHWEKI